MILPLDENDCEIFRNNDIESRIDFSFSELNKDDDSLLNAIFPLKDNPFYDLSKTKPFTGEIEYLHKPERIDKQESNNEKNKVQEIPEYFTLSKIKDLMNTKLSHEIIKELNQKIFLEKNLQKVESEIDDQVLLGKKRRKKNKLLFNEEDKKDIGRKKKEDNLTRKHNKYCGDNIIKKIKLKLLEGFRKFGNKVINETLDKDKLIVYNKILRESNYNNEKFEDLIKMIDYKYIDRLNKKIDLSILYMPFKELFSKNITSRFSKLKSDSNKIIIEPLISVLILGGLYLLLYKVSHGKWVGDGDWLLGVAIGLSLYKPWLSLVALFVANFIACIIMLPVVIKKKSAKIFFGPFLVAAFIITYVFKDIILSLL